MPPKAIWGPLQDAQMRDPFALTPAAAGTSELRRQYSRSLVTLLMIAFLVLLVACVNVAHLVLARSSERRQEMAIRQALGASLGRLTGQLAIESAVLAAAGGALGLLVASWGLRGLIALAPGRVPRIGDAGIDVSAVAVCAVIAQASTIMFGLVPALQLRCENAFAVV